MTAAEERYIDLAGRMAFVAALHEELIPYVQTLPTYGGLYIDQVENGGLVVLLTERDTEIEAVIASKMPSPNRGLTIRHVAHTYQTLERAWAKALRSLNQRAPGVFVLSTRVRTEDNQILILVPVEHLASAVAHQEDLAAKLGVPVLIAAGELDTDAACTSRDACDTPLMAGIRINDQSTPQTIPDCTMAFHIQIGVDEHFVTAGHCDTGSANLWYTGTFGQIGSRQATLYPGSNNNGQDIMYVSMLDSQRSDDIYRPGITNGTDDIVEWRAPVDGEAACGSLGRSDANDCGTVEDITVQYWSDTLGVYVDGGDTSGIAAPGQSGLQDGDSGSPLYHMVSGDADAIGVLGTVGGNFARLDTSLDDWGASVFLN